MSNEFESRILQPEEWETVGPIVRAELGHPMPSPLQSTFPCLFDGDNVAGFVWVEHLYHFNSVYVMPEYRHQGLARRLLFEAAAKIPKGHAAICLPDPKQEHLIHLAERMGARRLLSRVVLRKDVV